MSEPSSCAGRPPKPWERADTAGSTSMGPVDGLPKPWERPCASTQTVTPAGATTTALAAVTQPNLTPVRPWERQSATATGLANTSYGSSYTGGPMYSRPHGNGFYGGGYGSGIYGAGYGGSMYGGGMYGGMYGRPGWGGAMYGSAHGGYGGSLYGGGMHGSGMYGGPNQMGPYGPSDPHGPPQPPSAWQAMLHAVSGVVHFFGRLSFLVDENAHAVHFFISALLQLLDRFGSLYGELARFVLRLLGFRSKEREQKQQKQHQQSPSNAPAGALQQSPVMPVPAGPVVKPHGLPGMPRAAQATAASGVQWDSLWST